MTVTVGILMMLPIETTPVGIVIDVNPAAAKVLRPSTRVVVKDDDGDRSVDDVTDRGYTSWKSDCR